MNNLFNKKSFGSSTSRNRFAMAPMTRSKSPGGIPTEAVFEYYLKRAIGEVGVIITEGLPINHLSAQGYKDVPNLYAQQAQVMWKKIVDAAHDNGSLIIPQLWHVGSLKHREFDIEQQFPTLSATDGVNPILLNAGLQKPRAKRMNDSDISEIIDSFSEAACTSKRLGFDGIEVHGAHGYLIDQFFSKSTNNRKDKYSESIEARSLFAKEVVSDIRSKVGSDFPIVFRFSQWRIADYEHRKVHNPKELETMLRPLLDAGVDIFHASTRDIFSAEFEGSDLNLAGWTKKITGKPVISVGGIGLGENLSIEAERLNEFVEEQDIDFVAIGRALVSDPNFVQKLRLKHYYKIIGFDQSHLDKL